MKHLKINCNRGFTLIEILVATTISSLVLIMVYTSYRSVLTTVRDITAYAEFYENVNLSLRRIDRDISNAYYRRKNKNAAFIAESDNVNSSLHFVTVNHRNFRILGDPKQPYPSSDVNEVSYYLKEDPKIPDLFFLYRREERHYDEEPMTGGTESVMLENVTGLRFEFKVRNDWTARWDSRETRRFPKLVKTILKVKNYSGKEEEFSLLSYIDMSG